MQGVWKTGPNLGWAAADRAAISSTSAADMSNSCHTRAGETGSINFGVLLEGLSRGRQRRRANVELCLDVVLVLRCRFAPPCWGAFSTSYRAIAEFRHRTLFSRPVQSPREFDVGVPIRRDGMRRRGRGCGRRAPGRQAPCGHGAHLGDRRDGRRGGGVRPPHGERGAPSSGVPKMHDSRSIDLG